MTNKEDKQYLSAVSDIQKRYGKDNLAFFGQPTASVSVIPTGSCKLNAALGVGGIPQGRIIEIYGNESSGKTTLALQLTRECQRAGGRVAYIDAENGLDPRYAQNIGVEVTELLVANPQYGEQAFAVAEALIKTGMINLLIIDSVAALVPKAELEGAYEDQGIGLLARMMSKGLRRLQAAMQHSSSTVVFINQLREKVGVVYGNPEVTPGGRALKFYSSVRIEMKRAEVIKEDDGAKGIRTRVTISKNKVAAPMRTVYLDLFFDRGVDYNSEIIDLAIAKNIITKNGS